jgi:hypothetical protein
LSGNGIVSTASVTLPAGVSGEIDVIRKASFTTTQYCGSNNTAYVLTSNGFVLDNKQSYTEPLDPGYLYATTSIAAGGTGILTTPNDPPSCTYLQTDGPNGSGENNEYKQSQQFQDFLAFRETGGIWVELAESDVFTMQTDAVWNGNTNAYDATLLQPMGSGSVSTSNKLDFVSWTDYYTNVNQFSQYNPQFPQ